MVAIIFVKNSALSDFLGQSIRNVRSHVNRIERFLLHLRRYFRELSRPEHEAILTHLAIAGEARATI